MARSREISEERSIGLFSRDRFRVRDIPHVGSRPGHQYQLFRTAPNLEIHTLAKDTTIDPYNESSIKS